MLYPSGVVTVKLRSVWIDGGPDALTAHRQRIADEGVQVSPFADDQKNRPKADRKVCDGLHAGSYIVARTLRVNRGEQWASRFPFPIFPRSGYCG